MNTKLNTKLNTKHPINLRETLQWSRDHLMGPVRGEPRETRHQRREP